MFPVVVEGETEEEEEYRTARQVGDLLFQAIEELGTDFDFRFEGFMLGEDKPPIAPSHLIDWIRDYLTELEMLLEEAQARFGAKEGQ